ncbi:hypothetical protein PACTADRAFT_50983 [Pachysolen tannophilus NRRL Y-2460]|uniref:DNA ligase n=1 Tax=Pachysolen tannophilus NRRL Y-2460 TaxID=669874 RepID=A0A1E4TQS3_PACTA|nr:hypothetical protein PACTADRAFT_50983 [Pachysolen tannophilus NRRL Y-2460]
MSKHHQQQTLGRFFSSLKRPEDARQQKVDKLINKNRSNDDDSHNENEVKEEEFLGKEETEEKLSLKSELDSNDEQAKNAKRISSSNDASTPPPSSPPRVHKKQKIAKTEEEEGGEEEEKDNGKLTSTVEDTDPPSSTEQLEEDPYSDTDSEDNNKPISHSKPVILLENSNVQKIEVTKTENKENSILYSDLCEIYDKLENESSRLKNLKITSEFIESLLLSDISQKSLTETIYLLINRLGPDYEGLELGLGETILLKALGEATGRELKLIKQEYNKLGDIGLVAKNSRSKQPTMFKAKPLDILLVFNNLTKIAKLTGNQSQQKKIGIIKSMVSACQPNESKFLLRTLEGKLRINFGEKSVLVALAQAFISYEYKKLGKKKIDPEVITKAEDVMKDAFSQLPNYGILIETAFKYGVLNVGKHCSLRPGIPLKPMLAKPTKSITEILDRFHDVKFTCEYKYDGERCQLHLLDDGSIKIFSRNSEDMSERYPDLIDVIQNLKQVNSDLRNLILDCEAVAYNREEKTIMPFQVLSTRKRKDVQAKDIKVRVCLFAFDLLFFNGEPLITKSLSERREIMKENLHLMEGEFEFATSMDTSNIEEIQTFLDLSVKNSCEGLMVKMLEGKESAYEPSKRSRNWLKLKKDYLQGVGDSLDLAVIGAYIGKGKRTGWYGGFLLASYNQDTGEYETTCKIGTGFSEEMLAKLYEQLKPTEIPRPKPFYVYDNNNSNAVPDVWFEPSMVFEVLTADLSLSPIYKAGASTFGKGISLRFPRFLRIRDDKNVDDATSSEQIIELYQKQANAQS